MTSPQPQTPPTGRLRVAVVVQRYGLEVNGGAELHARLFVQHVRHAHEVQVLTTCARDYTTWDSHYPAGPCDVDGIRVLRFEHPQRGHSGRARVPQAHLWRYRLRRLFSAMNRVRVAAPSGNTATDGPLYLERQGPCCPDLVEHLRGAAGLYDVVVFFTALYYPTAIGLPLTTVPTVLVPTLHDERSMVLPAYAEVFKRASWILWNCRAEQQLAQRLYGDVAPGCVCGVGIDIPSTDLMQAQALRERLGLRQPYFVFVGRVTRSKGFDVLARAFARLQARLGGGVQLAVIGQGFMAELPQVPGIVYTGFVQEAERDALMAGAVATVVTSKHESLSLVTLESLALGVPVVVNGRSEVLKAHVQDSGAGLVYEAPWKPLAAALQAMLNLSAPQRQAMAQAGRAYVQRHYAWARVDAVWLAALQRAVHGAAAPVPGLEAETSHV